ncbi:hypothetical protein COCNU_scaffold033439G000010 [Cocos nucifera]|nr:hypothetical protein [Cocos nucifera]
MAALAHRGKNNEFLVHLEKIAEAAFLMVVVFAAEVSKHKLNSKSSHEFRPEVAVKILVTFSCIEYLRRTRLPEYTDAVRRAVLTLQENAASSASFVESMPSYVELTKPQGMTPGVAAIVRHLPAGSPAIFYCIHSLVAKATDLCRKAMRQDAAIWKTWEGSSEPFCEGSVRLPDLDTKRDPHGAICEQVKGIMHYSLYSSEHRQVV